MTNILVIEDDDTILENVIEVLQLSGYEVHGEHDGLRGIDYVHRMHPDLILCDIVMPFMDGYGVLIDLRSDAETMSLPFIFMTAKAERHEMRYGMALGADDYLIKPFNTDQLLTAVNTRLERHTQLAKAQKMQMAELRSSIVHMLPHEFRTPLTAILGYTDIILEAPESWSLEQIISMVERVNHAGWRLFRMVENFQVYAQIALLRSEPDRLIRLRQDFTETPGALIEQWAINKVNQYKRNSDLDLQINEVERVCVAVANLKKIVEELVDNACKFSKEGTPITVSASDYTPAPKAKSLYGLQVTDQGRGMTAGQIAQVGAYMQFERRLHEQQGSGLGLTVAKELAELYEGRLTIESVLGQHTTVFVVLPL